MMAECYPTVAITSRILVLSSSHGLDIGYNLVRSVPDANSTQPIGRNRMSFRQDIPVRDCGISYVLHFTRRGVSEAGGRRIGKYAVGVPRLSSWEMSIDNLAG